MCRDCKTTMGILLRFFEQLLYDTVKLGALKMGPQFCKPAALLRVARIDQLL